ncbi:hypothetical protein GCM10017764_19770 [Sphingobacterium griseoflavum]|uniref:DUF983 domain-containing protein n=2 Tax=Sphingobacterium griseoflavum TaxID=1474952 RepID=A0ABQ3HVU5_9SPHI|nr:hypothetical protein GCM10017764_19770 [Sphingobacterium griseoflavum]
MFAGGLMSLKGQKMAKYCPHCALKFEMEPGFFYVSMFVSYALNVAQFIAVCVATYVFSGQSESPWLYLVVCCLAAIFLAGFNFRYARVIQLYWLTPNLDFIPRYYGEKYNREIKVEA